MWCIAHAEVETLRALLRSPRRQSEHAIPLMEGAGIPRGTLSSPTEWHAFQRLLGRQYGIVVLSLKHMNLAMYNSMPETPKKLVLWHTGHH